MTFGYDDDATAVLFLRVAGSNQTSRQHQSHHHPPNVPLTPSRPSRPPSSDLTLPTHARRPEHTSRDNPQNLPHSRAASVQDNSTARPTAFPSETCVHESGPCLQSPDATTRPNLQTACKSQMRQAKRSVFGLPRKDVWSCRCRWRCCGVSLMLSLLPMFLRHGLATLSLREPFALDVCGRESVLLLARAWVFFCFVLLDGGVLRCLDRGGLERTPCDGW